MEEGAGRKGDFIGEGASGEGDGKMNSLPANASSRAALAYREVKCRNEVGQCRDLGMENEA